MGEQIEQIVGRDSELSALRELLGRGTPPGVCVLTGGPGAGKTTLWEAGIEAARQQGLRVLSARSSGADAEPTFAALIDLLDGVDLQEAAGLPAPQRRALDAALLRADPGGAPAEPHAIRVAFLTVVRSLALVAPVLLAIDDLQWLDVQSAEVLVFAARRLEVGRVGFLLARRPGDPSALERALGRFDVRQLEVGPLSLGAIRRVLSERLGLTLHRQLLRRIVDTTLGNPLFALEVGRSVAERGLPDAGKEIAVPEGVEDALGTRVALLAEPLRALLLAVALSGDLRVAQLELLRGSSAVDDAVEAGLLVVDGDRVRASHPLLAAAARSRAGARGRRELHLELARVVSDLELRALHLALATEQPDAALAATVSAAAKAAAARGAAQEAVVLAEHALRITTPGSPERSERLLELAGYLEVAGDLQRVSTLIAGELDSFGTPSARVQALLLLSEGGANQSSEDSLRFLERALVESGGDPLLRAPVLAKLSSNWSSILIQRIPEAEAWAEEALLAARAADPELERHVLQSLSWARGLRGRPVDDLRERFRAISGGAFYLAVSPERVAAQRLVWRGEIEPARTLLTDLRTVADERGEAVSYALLRLHLCELELRAGAWADATELLDEWGESSDDELLLWPMYERCRALLAAGRGLPDEAERWASQAIARAEAVGVRWDQLEALRAIGIAALLAHDPARAAESLGAVAEHTTREQVDEPGVFPFAPDLVEALAELREFGQAEAVTTRLAQLAEEQLHPWALTTAARCAALVELASSAYDERAAWSLEQAAAEYARLGLRFDHARTLLSLGRAQRRARKWGAARHSLELAAAAFDGIGSTGWGEEARAELARVGARRPQASGTLTPAEQRVAALASQGLSNKEIAQTLFVTVNTVEAHLTHAYAKLGVRSRTQLAQRLAVSP